MGPFLSVRQLRVRVTKLFAPEQFCGRAEIFEPHEDPPDLERHVLRGLQRKVKLMDQLYVTPARMHARAPPHESKYSQEEDSKACMLQQQAKKLPKGHLHREKEQPPCDVIVFLRALTEYRFGASPRRTAPCR